MQANSVLLNSLQFEAQNARVTHSLTKEGPNSSLFSLYLAMQITDPALHVACEFNSVEDVNSYSSMATDNNSTKGVPKPNLYSNERDYVLQRSLYAAFQSSKQPHIHLGFLNAFAPQPLHYSEQEVLLPVELISNLPFDAQAFYQRSNQSVYDDESTSSEYSTDYEDVSSVPTDILKQATLDTFIKTIEQSRGFDL